MTDREKLVREWADVVYREIGRAEPKIEPVVGRAYWVRWKFRGEWNGPEPMRFEDADGPRWGGFGGDDDELFGGTPGLDAIEVVGEVLPPAAAPCDGMTGTEWAKRCRHPNCACERPEDCAQ